MTIVRPDDWHLHLRDGDMLASVVKDSAAHFARALVMPNLVPPVVTGSDALAYRERITAALGGEARFKPLMTLYLTERTDSQDVKRAVEQGVVTAVKLYPAGATTNSQSGVRNVDAVIPVLEAMAEASIPLCVHGEVTDPDVDIFDREAAFIARVLEPLRRRLPGLRVVMEHLTTADGVEYVRSNADDMAATITTHHLILNRNHLLAGGIRPHYYCLPVAKREIHREALVAAAVSGHPAFFLGTDSAPHLDADKLSQCGCAGIYTAPNAMACLAQVFENNSSLGTLEAFTSLNGASFYGVERNADTITLERSAEPLPAPPARETGEGRLTVFDPGMDVHWQVVV